MHGKAALAAAFDAAAEHYDDPLLGFWDYFGRRTIGRLGLPAGARVIDVCCGAGASALPAAEAVGPGGEVLGVDLSPALLELARAKARERGLTNVRFEVSDFEAMARPAAPYDAAVCVFGIFFFKDMAAALRSLASWVRPGGIVAVTSWGTEVLEPADRFFWEAVRAERPDLAREVRPWDRISTPQGLTDLFAEAGLPGAVAVPETWTLSLPDPEDFWRIVLGSGYRSIVDQLDAPARERVRRQLTAQLRDADISRLAMMAVYGSALTPS